jgi:hypothetical protein
MTEAEKARANPGLKQLTPYEKALVARMYKADRDRWTDLFARNKWTPDLRTPDASSSRPRASSRV